MFSSIVPQTIQVASRHSSFDRYTVIRVFYAAENPVKMV